MKGVETKKGDERAGERESRKVEESEGEKIVMKRKKYIMEERRREKNAKGGHRKKKIGKRGDRDLKESEGQLLVGWKEGNARRKKKDNVREMGEKSARSELKKGDVRRNGEVEESEG